MKVKVLRLLGGREVLESAHDSVTVDCEWIQLEKPGFRENTSATRYVRGGKDTGTFRGYDSLFDQVT